jgi:hypothetical protein
VLLATLLAGFAGAVVLASRAGSEGFKWSKTPKPKGKAQQGSFRTLAAVRNANAMPVSAPVCITAVGTANARGPVDIRGTPHDYVEIQNISDRPFNLTGCTLTDRASRADKWKFPPLIIPPGGWLIVWASGLDCVASLNMVRPTEAEPGSAWLSVPEYYKYTEKSVWQCISPVETNATLPGETSLRYPIRSEVPAPHTLWLYMQSAAASTSRILLTFNEKQIAVEISSGNAYRFYPILNPDRLDGAWPLGAEPKTLTVDLVSGAVRASRLVAIGAEEPCGNGAQDLHMNFRINREGDFVGLFSPNGVPLDYVTTPAMEPGESYRRSPDRYADFSIMPSFSTIRHIATPPRISPPAGVINTNAKVEMQSSDLKVDIRYTLDGSLPDESSPLYTAPFFLESNTVVRARAFKAGSAASASTDRSYWFDNVGPLPVLSVAMEQEDLDDPESGLFATRLRRGVATERPCHLTLIEPDGKIVSARAGIRVQGRSTRVAWLRKNWRFTLRERYGDHVWPVQLFDQTGPTTTASFVALAGGHAQLQAVYDAATAAGLRTPRTRLVAMYVNSRPYGIYLLADDISDPHYLEQAFGHLDLSVYKMKTKTPVKWGATNAFDKAWGKLLATPPKEVTTNMVARLMDLTPLTRFYNLVHFFGIGDAGQGFFIRDNRSTDQRWTMALWDMEGAFYERYRKFVFSIPHEAGSIFRLLSSSELYMKEVYYPEMQALVNHAISLPRLTAILQQHEMLLDRYAYEDWASQKHQHSELAATMTRETHLSELHSYLANANSYLATRTDDVLSFIKKELGQEAIHRVTVTSTADHTPLLIDGYPSYSGYSGRYINETTIRIASSAGDIPLRFDVNGVIATNSSLFLKVTEPLTISVSSP